MAIVSSVPTNSILPPFHQIHNNYKPLSPLLPIQPYRLNLRCFCCSQTETEEISEIKNELQKIGFSDSDLGIYSYNNLLSFYSKNGRLEEAHAMFDKMPERNDVSWSTIISAYTRYGNFLKAFDLLEEMLEEGLRPNEFALVSLLKASSGLRDVCIGRQLHGLTICGGYGLDVVVHTSLITMYSNCGFLEEARRVFDGILRSSLDDAPLWNSIIAAYVFHECWTEGFELFESMMATGLVSPTRTSYASMINACSNTKSKKYGKAIHGMIVKDGVIDDTMTANSLVTFYMKCGILEDANRLFERISRKNVVSWNAIIAGHEQNGEEKTAIDLFYKMVRFGEWVQPNRITFLSVLKSVSAVSSLKHGKEIHGYVIKSDLECEAGIGSSLITMYSKCRDVDRARLVFKRLPSKDIITWNSMLTAYEQNERWDSCLRLFKKMLVSGIKPDNHSFTVILGAASAIPYESENSRTGRAIHCYILKRSSHKEMDISTSNAMITMYAKSDRVSEAEKIFRGISEKDSYSWNAIMDAYSLSGRPEDAMMIFLDKHERGLPVDYLTFSILLTACSRLVSYNLGKQFHGFIYKNINSHDSRQQNYLISINNAMISMYSKCGSISDAAQVFLRMKRRDVFSWTAMITGYAHHGMAYESLDLFERMKQEHVKPNVITFLGVLTACAHAGLVEEGIQYFNSMSKDHNISPTIEHYACMVDLFGRSGRLEQAKEIVESASLHLTSKQGICLTLWKVLLGACHAHKKLELGVYAAAKILEMEPEDETTHILLSNLYAASGMWEDSIRIRKLMRDKGLKKKEIGCSWLEASHREHLFVAGDVSHPQREAIYAKLVKINEGCRELGYAPMTEYVLHDVEESQKEEIIGYHSEKLAVSFALLHNGGSQRKGTVIRVIKNLRICGDCHNWMKFTSQVEKRVIVLRDSRRFHMFKDGRCSCNDYW